MTDRIIVGPADFKRAGYKPFRDRMREGLFYEGNWQKRIDDERGKRYFITVSLWQFPGKPMAASADCQFHDLDNMEGGFCNVTRNVDAGIAEVEAFFSKLWLLMNFGHYEVWSHTASPHSPLQDRDGEVDRG